MLKHILEKIKNTKKLKSLTPCPVGGRFKSCSGSTVVPASWSITVLAVESGDERRDDIVS